MCGKFPYLWTSPPMVSIAIVEKKKGGLMAMLDFLILFVQIKVGKYTKVMLINTLGIAKGWER